MNKMTTYIKLLRLRTIFKRIQQLSWTTSKLEQKYDLDAISNEEQIELCSTYFLFADELKEILDELQHEQSKK